MLVYFIGSYDPNLIGKFKRTITFTKEDFEKIHRALIFFSKVVTTPNILTEVNSLSNQLPEDVKQKYFVKIKEEMALLEENYLESKSLSEQIHFPKFGLTDTSIIELVKDKYLVLTDDLRLASYLETLGIDVINFNHLRDF